MCNWRSKYWRGIHRAFWEHHACRLQQSLSVSKGSCNQKDYFQKIQRGRNGSVPLQKTEFGRKNATRYSILGKISLIWNIPYSLPFLISQRKGQGLKESRKIYLKATRNMSDISNKGNRVTFFFSNAMFWRSLLKSNLLDRRGCFGNIDACWTQNMVLKPCTVETLCWWQHIYNVKDISNPGQQTGIKCIPLLQDTPNDIAGIYFQVHQMPLARSPKVIIFYPLLAYHSESEFQKRDCLKS